MKPALYLLPILLLTVILLIRAEILLKRKLIYIFKPLSTLLVIAIAALSLLEPIRNTTYTVGILTGLLLSLGGDLALMFQENRKAFTLGLGLFLLAHVAYIITFILLSRFSVRDILPAIILLAAGIGFCLLLKPNLGKMKVPVIVYILVISLMVSRAFGTLDNPVFSTMQAPMIITGAILFYISDVILAACRFWKPWKYHRISLAFYYSSQILLALAASYFL